MNWLKVPEVQHSKYFFSHFPQWQKSIQLTNSKSLLLASVLMEEFQGIKTFEKPPLCISCVLFTVTRNEHSSCHHSCFCKGLATSPFLPVGLGKNVIYSCCKTISKCLCIRRATPKRNADVHIQKQEARKGTRSHKSVQSNLKWASLKTYRFQLLNPPPHKSCRPNTKLCFYQKNSVFF